MKNNDNPEKLLEMALNKSLFAWDGSKASNFNLLARGWETDIYSFDKTKNGHSEALVMRIYAPGQTMSTAVKEWRVLEQLQLQRFPVPTLSGNPPGELIDERLFFLMERIEGYPLWSRLKTEDDYTNGLTAVARLMADLHQIDPMKVDLGLPLPANNREAIRVMLAEWQGVISSTGAMAEAFTAIMAWFEAKLKTLHDIPLSVLHFDLHPENVMVEAASGRLLVIDWTGVCINDPRLDVFWAALLVGHQTAETYFDVMTLAYEQVSGKKLKDREFFEALVCFRRIGSLMISATMGAEKVGMQGDVGSNIARQVPILKTIYRRFLAATQGLRIEAVEEFLSQFS